MTPPRVFVTGTDTDVGKTVVAAIVGRAWDADYWKPVQTGAGQDSADTTTVARLAGLSPDRTHLPRHQFAAPLSPHAAAALEGARIGLDDFAVPDTPRPLVMEGAGGVLVPLNDEALMIDLIARLGTPVLVVARSTLGTINHTLLTLSALKARAIPVMGVVMNGPPSASNRQAIEHHGGAPVLAELPHAEAVTPEWVAAMAGAFPPPPR